jgi:hypothetical protein
VVIFAMPLITRSTTGASLTTETGPSLLQTRKPMDESSITTGTHEADEDILTYTVSDEAIEAAAGIERMAATLNEPICRPTILLWC